MPPAWQITNEHSHAETSILWVGNCNDDTPTIKAVIQHSRGGFAAASYLRVMDCPTQAACQPINLVNSIAVQIRQGIQHKTK
jgi:hypothetical protein